MSSPPRSLSALGDVGGNLQRTGGRHRYMTGLNLAMMAAPTKPPSTKITRAIRTPHINITGLSECALVPRDIRGTAIDPHRFVTYSRTLVRQALRASRWGRNFAADRRGYFAAEQTAAVGGCGKSLRSERHG